MNSSYRRVGIVGAFILAAAVSVFVLGRLGVAVPVVGPVPGSNVQRPTPSPNSPIFATVTPAIGTSVAATPSAGPPPASRPSTIFIPFVSLPEAEPTMVATGTPVPTSSPEPTAIPPSSTAVPPTVPPTPTRGPIRITKLGLGVYASGGGMLGILDQARPSVILLMDPTPDFAHEVRQRFPKAFLVGRIYTLDQPLDNPSDRGTAYADRVAALAVPLKGVVDAWMSYNEVGNYGDPTSMTNYNSFQVAFAHRLQDYYGIPAVAGNDGPRAIPAEFYPKYYAEAIRTSKYFGFHSYPDRNLKSLRDPLATDQVFYYRKIHAALDAAGITSGPFLATEIGLYDGWQGITSDTDMARDFIWVADQMNNDPFVLGMMIFGTFRGNQWAKFEIGATDIPTIVGDYNTVH